VDFRIASAGYFPAMGIRLARGVGFSEGDAYLDGTPVLVSETMAREVFGTTDPIGQRIRTGPFAPWMTITGVVTDVRNRSLTEPPKAEVYLPFAAPRSPMGVSRDMFVVMRTAGSADRLRADAERAIRSINPDLPIYDARSYTDIIRQSRTREDTITWLLTAFAVVALSLAVAGSYAMLMFTVVQRKREFALRQAVGAAPGDLVNLIGGEMSKLLGVGLLAGLVGTLLLSKVLASFLFRVTPLDPRVTIGTLLVLGTAGFTAAVLPARRAGQVDPTLTLRE
jgi:putative ABC transport system permease protein